jgi:hypothetical protein
MAVVYIMIEVEGGVATISKVEMPPDVTVHVTLRDYDVDGSDPDDLDADEDRTPCFISVTEYSGSAEPGGFI